MCQSSCLRSLCQQRDWDFWPENSPGALILQITIENKDTFSKDFEYNIYDILGRKLLQGTSVFGQKIIIDFVEKGYIIIEIKYGDKVNRRKIIKI